MTEHVMNINALHAYFVATFHTERVRVRESDSVVTIEPVAETPRDCTIGLRGMFADCPEISVDKFLMKDKERNAT